MTDAKRSEAEHSAPTWPDGKPIHGGTRIPAWMWAHAEVREKHLRMVAVLDSFTGGQTGRDSCVVKLETIAARRGFTGKWARGNASNVIAELAELGAVKVEARFNGKREQVSSRYTLARKAPWVFTEFDLDATGASDLDATGALYTDAPVPHIIEDLSPLTSQAPGSTTSPLGAKGASEGRSRSKVKGATGREAPPVPPAPPTPGASDLDAPGSNRGSAKVLTVLRPDDPVTEPQLRKISYEVHRTGAPAPDTEGMTKGEASALITELEDLPDRQRVNYGIPKGGGPW